LNESDPTAPKNVSDKDIRFFMQYMDLDRNQTVSKGEFLKYFQKIEALSQRLFSLYKQYEDQAKVVNIKGDSITTEKDTRAIVVKMQKEGINLTHFINHLPSIVDFSQSLQTNLPKGIE